LIKIINNMKKLFLFALPLLLISCKGVEQYRAGIEELSGNWDNTTKAVTDFSGMVSSDLTNYTKALAGVQLDEMTAKKLKPEQTSAWTAAQKAVTDALGAYAPLQQNINDFVKTWSEKSADLTALKDGLAAGKIEGDVTAKLAELGGLVTTANDNLTAWTASYGTVKGGVDTAMAALTQLMGTLAPAAPAKK
jgi:hypothetical protein